MNETTPRYVNTTQVARSLGVSVSTVKRWVDDGILPARKTAGGHRKLLLADVLELARRGKLPQLDLSLLPLPAPISGKSHANAPERLTSDLHRALRSGNYALVRGLVLGTYRSGVPVEVLADRVVAPALVEIGTDWESGAIEVMEEHRASQMCASALYELKALIENRAAQKLPLAVGGAVSGDPTIVPSLLAQLVLIDAGWDAVNLGPNTPFSSFVRALDKLRPKLLWLSVSHATDPATMVEGCRKVYHRAEQMGVPLAVGGRALSAPLRQQILYTTHGDGMTQLAAFARTLAPPPRPPQRGRPRKR